MTSLTRRWLVVPSVNLLHLSVEAFADIGSMMQQIQYAKTKSDTIAKLDGTFRMPSAAAGAVTATELQQSIFNAPPSAAAMAPTHALPPRPEPAPGTLKPPMADGDHSMEEARSPASVVGQKRRRDEEEEEDEEDSEGDVAMEEDSDDE